MLCKADPPFLPVEDILGPIWICPHFPHLDCYGGLSPQSVTWSWFFPTKRDAHPLTRYPLQGNPIMMVECHLTNIPIMFGLGPHFFAQNPMFIGNMPILNGQNLRASFVRFLSTSLRLCSPHF